MKRLIQILANQKWTLEKNLKYFPLRFDKRSVAQLSA